MFGLFLKIRSSCYLLRLYVVSVSYLKVEQIFFRLIRVLFTKSSRPISGVVSIEKGVAFRPPIKKLTSLIGPETFKFLNVTGQLREINWVGSERELLWRYNQNYFDFINSPDVSAETAFSLIKDWIETHQSMRRVSCTWILMKTTTTAKSNYPCKCPLVLSTDLKRQ